MVDCGCTPMVMPTCTPLCSGGSCTTPGWNLYDVSENNPEHALFESHLCEVTDVAGFSIEWRRVLPEHDQLYGEDPNNGLTEPMLSKCIYAPEEETALLDMFGITGDDTLQYMMIPKAIFVRDMSEGYLELGDPDIFVQPQMGDVVTTLWNNRNYEVVSVTAEQNIFLAKKFVWELILRPYRYSEQSDQHREVHTGLLDDPFSTIVEGPSGQDIIERGYAVEEFGDNEFIESESDKIYDYEKEDKDPDSNAFGC